MGSGYMTKQNDLGLRMKTVRKANRLTQQQVADILSIDRTTYTAYEISKNMPDIMLLDSFAKIFSTTVDAIVNLDLKDLYKLHDDVEEYDPKGKRYTKAEREERIETKLKNDDRIFLSELNKEEKALLAEFRVLSEKDKKKIIRSVEKKNPFRQEAERRAKAKEEAANEEEN